MQLRLRFAISFLLLSFAVSAQYCVTGVGPTSTFDTDIESVSLIGDNFSINNSNTCPGLAGVVDRTGIDSADVSIGTSYSAQVVLGTCNGGVAYYTSVAQAWIDWNQNGTFEVSESIGSVSAPNSAQPLSSAFSFTVPANAVLGETRMRIMNIESGVLPLLPCASFVYGAVEDYKLVVTNTPPACPSPSIAQIATIDDVSATVFWSSAGSSFNYEWGPLGFSQGTGTISSTTNDTLNITGLTPQTGYSIYIQNDCSASGSGTSQWVGPLNFTTLCGAVAAPYSENFDALPVGTSILGCWQIFENNPGFFNATAEVADASFGPTPNTAPNQLQFFNGFSNNCYLVSPIMAGLDQNLYQFQFAVNDGGTPLTFQVGTQASPGDTASFNSLATITTNGSYASQTVYLVGIPAGHKHISIKHSSVSTFQNLYFDDVSYDAVPSCIPPVGINIGALANTATVNYNFTGGASVNYEWGPAGFSQGTGTSGTSGSSPINISGLSPNTSYSIYLQGDCGAAGTSPWVGPFNFTTPCSTASLPYLQDFDTWPPACMTTTGGTQQWLHFGNDYARGNFWSWADGQTALLTTEPIFIDQDAQVSFEWSHQYQTFYPNDRLTIRARVVGAAAWDTIVNLSGPSFNTPNSGFTTPGDFNLEIAYLDAAIYTGQNVTIQMFAHSGFGPDVFVNDFKVEYIPTCPPPLQLSLIQAQGFQATVGWAGTGTAYNIEWGPAGFGQGSGTILTSVTNDVVITGLAPVTCYDVYVQNDCSAAGGGTSSWSGPFNFCTLVSCPAPTNLTVSQSTNDATFNWTSGGATDVNYVFGPAGVTPGTGTISSTTGSSVQITGLMPSTAYTFWVRDSCAAGDVSAWTGPLNFNTLCVPASIPYLRDFDGPNFPPLCWDLTGGSQVVSQNSSDYLRANFWGWPQGEDAYSSTEPITISSDARVKFRWSHLYNAFYPLDQMILRVRLANSSVYDTLVNKIGTTFTSPGAASTAPAPDADFIQETFNLDPAIYTGQDVIFQFIFNSGFGPDVFVDDFIVEPLPACPEPTTTNVISTGATTANVAWTNGNAAASTWYIEYGPAGFPIGTGTTITVNSNPYTITGLSPATTYSWFVRELCQNGTDTSGYSSNSNFTTLCAAITAPYLQTFTGTAAGIVGTYPAPVALPICWDLGGTQGGQRWETEDASGANENSLATGPFFDNTTPSTPGGMYIFLETSTGVSTSGPAMFTSPEIITSSLTNPNLSFAYHMYGATMDSLRVDIFSNGVWNKGVFGLFGQQQTAGSDPWLIANVPLSSFGDTIRVRFAGKRGASFTGDMSLDDIRVDEAPACPNPISLATVSTSTTDATVSWTAGSTSATTWFIEVGAPGFAIGTGSFFTATASPFTITGLNASSNYCFYVYELCANGTDTSLAAGPVCFSTQCSNASMPYLRDFNTWAPLCWDLTGGTQTFTQFNNARLFANFWSWTSGNYAQSTTEPIVISQDAQVEFDWSHLYSAAYPTDQLIVLAQIQGSTTWDTIVNLIGPSFTTTGAGNTTPAPTFSHMIAALDPATYTGQTIQLRMIANSGYGPDVFVDNFAVNPYSTCAAPTALNATGVGNNSVVLDWTAGSMSASTWYIEYGPNGFTLGTGVIVPSSSNPYTLSGLNAGTAYCAYVSELCAGGDTSAYSAQVCFTTTGAPPSCATPTALASSNVTCVSADLSWTSVTGSSVVQWGPSGFTPGAGTFVSTTSPYTLSGLTPGSNYDVYVADICANGDTSAYTNAMMVTAASGPLPGLSFTWIQSSTTAIDGIVDFDASATTNATTITWDFANGATGTGAIASATYTQNGQFFVTVTATNSCGSVDSTFSITVAGISIYEQTLLGASVNVYPNPTKSIVNVELSGDVNKDFSIELLNLLGQPIERKSVRSELGNANASFDLSGLPKGVYMIRIQSGNAFVTKRIQRN